MQFNDGYIIVNKLVKVMRVNNTTFCNMKIKY